MTAPGMELRKLRRDEAHECAKSDWLDRECRDRQIDTPRLAALIAAGGVEVPKRFRLRWNDWNRVRRRA